MENIELKKDLDKEIIVCSSDEIKVNKNTTISVPMNYKAVALVDEKVSFRIEPCTKKNLCKDFDKGLNGQTIKFVYVVSSSIPQMAWGFGNIQVNNERLKEAYRVGVNGKYIVEITDIVRLLKAFPNTKLISLDDLREKTISIVKTIGIPVLSKCFANTNISVFEIDSKLQDIRNDIKEALANESMLHNIGLKISELTVEGIHVNEEDLQIIRNRLNG